MIKEIHFFDLDGTLWNMESDIWVIDKNKPYKPVIKISYLEFSLIKNGVYRKDNIPLDYNGNVFYISKKMWNDIYRRKKSENIKRYGISFKNTTNKKDLNKTKINYLLSNIEHLRGKNVDIGILTARSNKKTHSDIINNLRLELKNMGISLNKIFFVGDKIEFSHTEKLSIKKVNILLEHLIGFKIKDNRFVPLRQDWYNKVSFYDDYKTNIDYANDCQNILNDILKNTDDELFDIIIERINTNNLILNNYLITNNEVNRFKKDTIEITVPIKFPFKLERYNDFSSK